MAPMCEVQSLETSEGEMIMKSKRLKKGERRVAKLDKTRVPYEVVDGNHIKFLDGIEKGNASIYMGGGF